MTHASLFSGIGGAEVAASMMGWRNLFHCEIQEFPRKVLDYWYPKAESYEDITKTDFTIWGGKVDVLTGGFPCQPFSLAGRRKGADDNRYLWPEMLRAIREIHPSWVVGENVAGIATMVESMQVSKVGRTDDIFEENYIYREESKFTLDRICNDIEQAGYSVQPIVIPACAVGAPHRRDRVWIIAHRTDARDKTVQQEGQGGVCSANSASHSNGNRQGKRTSKQEPFSRSSRTPDTCSRCNEVSSSHTDEHGDMPYEESGRAESGWRDNVSQQSERRDTPERTYGFPELPLSSDTECNGWSTKCNDDGKLEKAQQGESQSCGTDKPQGRWRNFPTQPPVCRGNDGLPFDVDDLAISFAKWRQESIKAYGNAWVPQVALEIFKAIETITKQQTK